MIRVALPLIALSLAGCAETGRPVGPGRESPLLVEPSACGAEHVQRFVGWSGTDGMAEAVIGDLTERFAKSQRWITHGTAVTMDYRADRLNVYLDDKGVITRIACG